MDAQLCENTLEGPQFPVCCPFSSTSQQLAEEHNDKCTFLAVILQLEKKHLISPLTAETLKDKCKDITKFCEINGFLKDMLEALKLPVDTSIVTPESSVPAIEESDVNSAILKNQVLEAELKTVTEEFQSIKKKCTEKKSASVKIKKLKATNARLKKQRENVEKELSIANEKCANASKLVKRKKSCHYNIFEKVKKLIASSKRCKDCPRLKCEIKRLKKEYFYLKKQMKELELYNKRIESTGEYLGCKAEQLHVQHEELKHEKYLDSYVVSSNYKYRSDYLYHNSKLRKEVPQKNKTKNKEKTGVKLLEEKKDGPFFKVGKCKVCYPEDYEDNNEDKSKESSKDENKKSSKDENGKSSKDENGKSSKDENGKSSKDENKKSSKDENKKSSKDENGKSSKDENGKSSKDENKKSSKDENGKSSKDENGKSSKDENEESSKEQKKSPKPEHEEKDDSKNSYGDASSVLVTKRKKKNSTRVPVLKRHCPTRMAKRKPPSQ